LEITWNSWDVTTTPAGHKNKLVIGTNTQVSLSVDSKEEADHIYEALSSTSTQPMKEMFWGSYFGYFTDSFGVQWMIDCPLAPKDKDEMVRKVVKDIRSATRTVNAAADQLEKLYEPASKKTKQK
jgi:predicted 3-demethylubiquinone-9 3-methyltransferase (glyoxalase superfamily)